MPPNQESERQVKIIDPDKEEIGLLPHNGGLYVKPRNSVSHLQASPCPIVAVNGKLQ